ncbi:MAG: DUF551 domain-containing protein [Planctomycetota bacterium]|jgi:hypothetical protein
MPADWIDVRERLPRKNEIVLAWSTLDDEYVLAQLTGDNNWHCQCLYDVDYFTRTGISHWAALPKVPEIVPGELIGDRVE